MARFRLGLLRRIWPSTEQMCGSRTPVGTPCPSYKRTRMASNRRTIGRFGLAVDLTSRRVRALASSASRKQSLSLSMRRPVSVKWFFIFLFVPRWKYPEEVSRDSGSLRCPKLALVERFDVIESKKRRYGDWPDSSLEYSRRNLLVKCRQRFSPFDKPKPLSKSSPTLLAPPPI